VYPPRGSMMVRLEAKLPATVFGIAQVAGGASGHQPVAPATGMKRLWEQSRRRFDPAAAGTVRERKKARTLPYLPFRRRVCA